MASAGDKDYTPIPAYQTRRKKYPLGGDIDKETVFDFHFLVDDETISYIEDEGRVMFIIRGPPSTGKATLSEMITRKYPSAAFCCADKYFESSFSRNRNKETIKASHVFCEKKAKEAAQSDRPIIIVQNTHMKKWEMQPYLNLAALHNYTVIMAITLYRFDVSPEVLFANNTDGLDFNYLKKRLSQWEDVTPLLTGWFLCPSDAEYVRCQLLSALSDLLGDGKFCRVYDAYEIDRVKKYFQPRRLLSAVAGFSRNWTEMKEYYLSDRVQDSYGKCFTLTILGYIVTPHGITGIVSVDEKMRHLIFDGIPRPSSALELGFDSLNLNNNILEHGKTIPFEEETESSGTSVLEEWQEEEEIDSSKVTFMPLAQHESRVLNAGEIRSGFRESLSSVLDAMDYTELERGTKVCRLPQDEWLVKPEKKIVTKAIFTGLYL